MASPVRKFPSDKRLLTAKEASAYLGIAEWTIRSWVSQRRLPVIKLGKSVRFDLADLDSIIAASRRPAREGR